MTTITLFRSTARIVSTALVGGATVLATVLATGGTAAAATPAQHGPSASASASASVNAVTALPFGPNTCKSGFVWREAFDGDTACVTPATRAQAKRDNAAGPSRINSADPVWGPQACKSGYVWRVARPSDLVCVTPDVRSQAAEDNRLAASRRATESAPLPTPAPNQNDGKVNAVFEVTGSGVADTVAIDDGPVRTLHDVALPFRTVSRVPADIDLLQVHVSGAHDTNTTCRIILNGKVVVSSPNGDCVYNG
jgi:hypothetical protein